MSYQYRLTPALKQLADEAAANGGMLFRSQVLQIVSNDRSSFYKLEKLGYRVRKKMLAGKNYAVHIDPPLKDPRGWWRRFESWFWRLDCPTRLLLYAVFMLVFLMLAKLFSEIV